MKLPGNKWIAAITIIVLLAGARESIAQNESKADSLLKAKKHFSFAVQYKKSGSYEQALVNYKQSIAYNDTVYQVHYSFGDLLLEMERPLEARREFAISLRLNPEHYNSAAMLAKLYYEAALYDSSLTVFETMYKLKPDDTQTLHNIGSLREHLGMKREALDAYEELYEATEATFPLSLAAGLAFDLEEWEKAKRYNDLMIEKTPGENVYLKRGANISLKLNDPQGALHYIRSLAGNGESDIQALERIEKDSRFTGDTDTVIAALKLHHTVAPDNIQIIGELAELLIAKGEKEKAADYLRRGIEKAPDNGKLRILMGNYYRERGEDDKALKEYEAALADETWKSSAQQSIWQIRPPQTEEEKKEQEFFRRGRDKAEKE